MLPNQITRPASNGAASDAPDLRRGSGAAGFSVASSSRAPLGPGQRCRICGCSIASDQDADRRISACGSCKTRPEAQRLRNPPLSRGFTEAERSLIRKVHGYLPPLQLLAILNDRLRADLGPDVQPYTVEQLHTEIATIPGAKPGGSTGWAGLRKLLAEARRTGTLDRINEQVINDFAIVFSLSPKELMRLKDILIPAED